MDALVDEFKTHNRRAAAVKLEGLITDASNPRPNIVDPNTIDPDKFVGLWVCKEFEGFGNCRGQVISHDVDMLGNTLYSVRYLDGDEEDLFLGEMTMHLERVPDELVSIIN